MSNQNIKCPNCGTEIELTEVLTGQIEQSIKARYQAEALEREKAFKAKSDELAKQAEAIAQQQTQIDTQVADKVKAEKAKLADQEKALLAQKEDIDRQIAEKLKGERKNIAEAERQKILAEQADTLTALNEELASNKKKLSEANKKELDLLKKQTDLETAQQNLELEVQRKLTEERKKLAEEAGQKAAEFAKQVQALEQQKLEIEAQAAEKIKAERAKLAEQEKALLVQKEDIERQIAEKLKAERKNIAEAERQRILEEQSEALTALNEELAANKQKLSEANKKELDLLKKQTELETAQENLELEVQRKLTEERKKIAEEAGQKATEQQMLKLREKDDQLDSMRRQIEDLRRKAELGSQEAQGEALEGELKEYLERSFPYDRFTEVKKGARGADVVQTVCNNSGSECGIILWESKNTKDFQKGWIAKLKGDQQDAKADIAVLMSMAMPAGVRGFGLYEGIWVTEYASAVGLATALRQGLIDASRQKSIAAGRDTIKDVIYNYITSQEFALHIRAVVSAYKQMKDDLEAEKRAMTKIWSKRDKQITTVLENVSGMYGSIEGIVGSQKALPGIDVLELDGAGEE